MSAPFELVSAEPLRFKPIDEAVLRQFLTEEVWVPYADVLEESSWPDGRMVTRWITDGYGSLDDAVETYRRHDRIAS